MLLPTRAISEVSGGVPRRAESRSFPCGIATRTRSPCAASARARAAQNVVLPTPPLPVTKRKRLVPSSAAVLEDALGRGWDGFRVILAQAIRRRRGPSAQPSTTGQRAFAPEPGGA